MGAVAVSRFFVGRSIFALKGKTSPERFWLFAAINSLDEFLSQPKRY